MRTRCRQRPSGPCPKCGVFREILHRDHIIPKWNGGADEPSNWQLLCANCHEDKTRVEARSDAMRQRMSALHNGHKMSPETKAILRAANLGRKLSDEHKAKIGNAVRGQTRKLSKEFGEQVKARQLKRFSDPSEREKSSRNAKIRCNTPEFKAFASEMARRGWVVRRSNQMIVKESK